MAKGSTRIPIFTYCRSCTGRPLIMLLLASGLKCVAKVVLWLHWYACFDTKVSLPQILIGGGGSPGVGTYV